MSTMSVETMSDPQTTMRVRKRSGSFEPVDVNKIVRAVSRCCVGLARRRRAARSPPRRSAGFTTGRPRASSISSRSRPPRALIVEEPQYAKLAARLLGDVHRQGGARTRRSTPSRSRWRRRSGWAWSTIGWPSSSPQNARKLNDAIDRRARSRVRVLRAAHGLRPLSAEAPADAPGARDAAAVLPARRLRAVARRSPTRWSSTGCSRRSEYLPSSPTLFNAGTRHEQLSSCFLLDSPADHLEAIYQRYTDVALLSKFSGGIGLAYHRVRSRGSLIEGTNGHSNGIVPWLKTLDASVAAVNQGGKRKGACCVYLEPWHADIEEFLALRDNTGDEAQPHPQPEPGQLDPRSVHAAGGGRRRLEPVRSQGRARRCRICSARRSSAAYVAAEARRAGGEDGQGARALRADDADAGADRQRLDDLQGQVEPRLQPDRCSPGADRSPVEPLHGDPRGDVRRRDGGLQPRLDQPRASHGASWTARRRFDFDEAGAHRAHRRPAARSGHRPQLLSDRHDRGLEPALAAGGAGRDGACRTSSSSCGCRSTPPEARALSKRIAEEIYFHALVGLRRAGGRARARTRRSPRRAPRAASCSSRRGA